MATIYVSGSTQERNIGVDGITEEQRMQQLAHEVADGLRAAGMKVHLNKPEWTVAQIVADSNAKKPDLHLALHSNAGGGSGTETWVYGLAGSNSHRFGRELQQNLVQALQLPDRGVKDATVPGRRLAEVCDTKATAVLTEIFFHDNAGDLARYQERRAAVVKAIVMTVCDWFNVPCPREVRLLVNGRDVNAVLKIDQGHVYVRIADQWVPVRAMVEALGAKVAWDPNRRIVSITLE